jgi:hypothetical protein
MRGWVDSLTDKDMQVPRLGRGDWRDDEVHMAQDVIVLKGDLRARNEVLPRAIFTHRAFWEMALRE